MSRRHAAFKRTIKPDTKYNNILVTKFINYLMKGGKKSIAENILYSALKKVKLKNNIESIVLFTDALNNVKPYLEVVSVRVGGANYQVPSPVHERRGSSLAIRWIINAAKKRSGCSMIDKISEELLDAYNNKGLAFKKKEDTHKMAESNKAFSHFIQRPSR